MVGGERQRSGMTGRHLGLHKKRRVEEGRRLLRRPLGEEGTRRTANSRGKKSADRKKGNLRGGGGGGIHKKED